MNVEYVMVRIQQHGINLSKGGYRGFKVRQALKQALNQYLAEIQVLFSRHEKLFSLTSLTGSYICDSGVPWEVGQTLSCLGPSGWVP